MSDLIRFDPDQADKLMKKLRDKEKIMKQALGKIERLVVETANKNWEGQSKKEYISLYSYSSEQVHAYLKKWLDEVAVFMDQAKEAKKRQDEAEAQSIKQAKASLITP